MFNVNLPTFLGITDNFGGGYSAGNNSNELTARELFNGLTGRGSDGIYHGADGAAWQGGVSQVLSSNLRNNWMGILGGVILIPVAAKVVTKVIRKPIILPANRMLKNTFGIKEMKL